MNPSGTISVESTAVRASIRLSRVMGRLRVVWEGPPTEGWPGCGGVLRNRVSGQAAGARDWAVV
ncbi:hypothetical protein BG846_05191 [Streptomyces fradiae ATCC 10745 = DSM 40063]|uniref:Uncharacterized protein n=1 Tax=Streptomyces fradiae ATCC 10745 = DSM 40063 TaxID=1319510 RepID=A0A1Y2NNY4_STRFR|nr:hypothetical protein BG846_05191 [Streptomyces fradiae ATCC 10745 = DSM 40063]